MRKAYVLLVSVSLLVGWLIGTVPAKPADENTISQLTYINTDWIVADTQIRKNEIIVLTGNLTVEFGGHLTLKNITLIMNSSAGGGTIADFYHIEVQRGGTMYILDYDNDNTTRSDASNITLNDINAYYWFWVRDGSNFTMKNSELHHCGGWSVSSGGAGFMVYTDNATIDHNLISNNYYGLILYGSDAIVSNNTIEWNDYTGILATAWSNGTIENNLIAWSGTFGIWVDGLNNVAPKGSNPLIKNNLILKTGRDVVNKGVAIEVLYSSQPRIIDNIIDDWGEDAMYVLFSSTPLIERTVFDGKGGNFGIVGGGGSWNWFALTNSSILNTVNKDIFFTGSGAILTNTSFNKSSVEFSDSTSNLTVNWFLHTKIENTLGSPIPSAAIRIQDNANGTFDRNFTTDANGYLNWTVLREFYQNKSTKILYTPYNITVEKEGYHTAYAEIDMNQSRYIAITLQADEPPIADAGPDQSVDEDDEVTFNGSGSADDVGIIWYNWSFGDGSQDFGTNITTNHTYSEYGTYIVTLNVTDTIGQWDEDTCLVFVGNVGPMVDAGGDLIGDEGQDILFDGSGSTDTSSDQPNLIYTWYFGDGETDTGMYVNHTYQDDGIYTTTLVVTDDNGFVDSDEISVTVNNVAPAIEPVPAQTILEDSLFTLQINATDVPADTLTFLDNTTLFDIDLITGLIEFTPTNDDVENHSVNVTVVDDDGGVNYIVFNIIVNNTNDPPTMGTIGQQSAVEDEEFTLQVDTEDVDVGDVLTYSLITSPAGMSIDDDGLISLTPTNDDVGTHSVTVKAEDAEGLYDIESFTLIVSNVNDAPTIVTNSLANATEDVFYTAFVHANDVDAGDTLIYSLDTSPAFLSINPLDGMIFGTPGNDDVGTHDVIVNVTDSDSFVTKTFTLNVVNVNDDPIIASNPALTADVGVGYSYEVIASDEDNDALTYSLAEGPDGMAVNGTKITWTPTNEQQGKTYQVVVEVTDGEITTAQSFVVSVGDVPEGTSIWPALLLGLVGGLISSLIITWMMSQRKKEEEPEEEKDTDV